VWERRFGKVYSAKCVTTWCTQTIDVWTFECAHDVAKSLGGESTIDNLVPMCSECNLSMGNQYTLKRWNDVGGGDMAGDPAGEKKRKRMER